MRKKIKISQQVLTSFEDGWSSFIIYQSSRGISDTTLKNYRTHLKGISKHLDITIPLQQLREEDLEAMVVSMRAAKLSHNSISTYLRVVNTFLKWCKEQGLSDVSIPNIREVETVKETYTDEELKLLLKKPDKCCDFTEYRNWVIINFFLNSGCRAATLRNIQNRDVDLSAKQVIFRHTKTSKIQISPLCSQMVGILREYMNVRKGAAGDYLFCSQYGEMLTENALRLAIAHYNKSRGVSKTSIHLFRHTFARKYLVDGGGNAFTLQKLLGHSTLEMSKRYCSIFDVDLAKDYDAFSPLAMVSRTKEKIAR